MIGHRQTGNETYIVELLSALATLSDLRVAAAVDPDTSVTDDVLPPAIERMPLTGVGNVARLGWGLATLCRRFRADVVHATYVSGFRCRCPSVVTVHDVSFRRFPQMFSFRDRLLFATLVPASLRRASAIVTDSTHAREEILRLFPRLRSPVTAIPLGVSERFRPTADRDALEAVRRRYAGGEYLLAVGNLQPRKNLENLIHAFARLRRRYPDLALVIAGQAQRRSSALFRLVASLGLTTAVRFAGYVRDSDLEVLYSAARLFVLPSTYEGFGLPILEAMACGTPVVAVATSSIPQVAGDAARLADAPTADALHDAMADVLRDEALSRTLVARGVERARRFAWVDTARRTRDVYRSVCVAAGEQTS